jgi:hypothetical protein
MQLAPVRNGFKMGKRGGMMPAAAQALVRSSIGDES